MERVHDRLQGKVAIVTGGGGGLGSAACHRLVEEGAQVVVADVDFGAATAVAEKLGDRAIAVEFDYRDERSIDSLIGTTIETWGRLDVLHNNGNAPFKEDGPLETADSTVWDTIYQVTLRGYALATKHAIPHLRAAHGGVIINMGSGAALSGGLALSAYGAMKAGVLALTKYTATQCGKDGIRAVSITPGAILTDTARSYIGEDRLESMLDHYLTPRLGEPAELGALVAFLASDEAQFLTGINIPLDGGYLSHQPAIVDQRR